MKNISDRVIKHTRKVTKVAKDFLGGMCVNCGIEDYDVLQFDHINNDGYKEDRKKYNVIDLWRKGNLTPDKFQLLCANCNLLKLKYNYELTRLENRNIPPF